VAATLFERLLLTGAAGALGRALRPAMRGWARTLRVSDIAPLEREAEHEEVVTCDLGDEPAIRKLLEGVEAVVHMGGISTDAPFAPILNANIAGVYNLYESARIAGTRRIVFASSNHAIGFHPRSRRIDADDPQRPDSLYGVSKTFGESLSRFGWSPHDSSEPFRAKMDALPPVDPASPAEKFQGGAYVTMGPYE